MPEDWVGQSYWQKRLDDFADEWQNLSLSASASSLEIALIGPKNSGKTLFAQGLAGLSSKSESFGPGLKSASGTDRVTWYGSSPPKNYNPQRESFVETSPLENLIPGKEVRLADVPGSNELDKDRAQNAQKVLQRAAIKILLLPANQAEDREWTDYLKDARGGWVLPILNLIRTDEQNDLASHLLERLREGHAAEQILPPLLIPDWGLSGPNEVPQVALQKAIKTICQTLATHLQDLSEEAILAPERQGRWENFQQQWIRDWSQQFPHTLPLVEKFETLEGELPDYLARILFQQNASFRYHYQLQVLSRFWTQSPGWLFPWKGFLGAATVLRGALGKIPFLFLGSLPSAAVSAFQAIRNTASLKAWKQTVSRDPSAEIQKELSEEMIPVLSQLDRALAIDLDLSLKNTRETWENEHRVSLLGISPFLRKNQELIEKHLAATTPGRFTATLAGFIGFFLFWGIFLWPLIGLYVDHFQAINNLWQGSTQGSWALFPSGAGSTFLTTFVLALFPVLLFIAFLHSLLLAPRRMQRSLENLREKQEMLLQQYHTADRLRIALSHPTLQALRILGKGQGKTCPPNGPKAN
ncbi:MAG: DUF456 domain-containing protein [Opitutales bacterium]|nr:DUF456 domain-containing protein [Opitutales bacterium]MCH8539232.1 hypothetical protein [Opitutales bacterium]